MSRKSSINKIKRDNSKSKNIEAALCMFLYLKHHSPITTHFTTAYMQECDVISISNSDYIYEYEIKISKADFKKDFEKQKHKNILNEKFISERKDELNFILPNYFNYVVPNGLISEEDVPEYAGLIYYNDDLTFEIIKKPKMLHKIKANNEFIRQIGHNLCCKLIFNKII